MGRGLAFENIICYIIMNGNADFSDKKGSAMTEKELRKLNRYQLLELLMIQTERNNELQKQLEDTRRDLESQQIRLSELGSIAEAALQLNGVFEAAQKAANCYLEAAREQAARIVEEACREQKNGEA